MDGRQSLLAKVHIGAKALGLGEDLYRDLLHTRFGVESARDLTIAELEGFVGILKEKGWKPAPARNAKAERLASDPQSRLIRALWIELHRAGKVKDPSERALRHFVRRVTGIEALHWLTPEQASAAIAALKAWKGRNPATTSRAPRRRGAKKSNQ
jgi:phage gp16-like protein